jgi:hypothetical protein
MVLMRRQDVCAAGMVVCCAVSEIIDTSCGRLACVPSDTLDSVFLPVGRLPKLALLNKDQSSQSSPSLFNQIHNRGRKKQSRELLPRVCVSTIPPLWPSDVRPTRLPFPGCTAVPPPPIPLRAARAGTAQRPAAPGGPLRAVGGYLRSSFSLRRRREKWRKF